VRYIRAQRIARAPHSIDIEANIEDTGTRRRGRAGGSHVRDEDLTLDAFRSRLADPDPEVRAYYLGKLMRQAKPDDVFTFSTLREIRELFPLLVRYLGRTRAFWIWVLEQWKVVPGASG
jgi:hypothetical protein